MAFGIPPLLNQASQAIATAVLLVSDGVGVLNLIAGIRPPWGIWKGGAPVLLADSVISLNFKADWRIVDYPMELGAFQSYNKVKTPFDARFRLTKGGTNADRKNFLDQVAILAESLDKYDVVSPEKVYINANIIHYDYDRKATSGLGLLSVDVWLREIRETVIPGFSKTAAPSGADTTNSGMLQPQPLPPIDAASVEARISTNGQIDAGH